MKRLPAGVRVVQCLAAAALALQAFTAGADHGKNHYILDCELSCAPPPVATVATATPIGAPGAVTTDARGNVYFSSPNIVFRLARDGTLARIAGNGTPGFAGDDGPATDALLNFPTYYPERDADSMDFLPFVGPLAVDAAGNVFIGDAYSNRIRRVDTAGTITTFAGSGDPGYPAPGTDIRFSWVQGLATGVDGSLYVSSTWGIVSRIDADGAVVQLAEANCGFGWPGPGVCAPEQIAVDRAGNVFVPDGYCRVRKVGSDGSITTYAGFERPSSASPNGFAWDCGYSGEGTPATETKLSNFPYGVAVDAAGNVYIADTYNHCVRKVDGSRVVTTVAGVCRKFGYAGDGGRATDARLWEPRGVALDRRGNLYIADTGNHRIRKVARNGIISTVAGNGEALPQ